MFNKFFLTMVSIRVAMFVSLKNLKNADVIVDIEKSYALRRIEIFFRRLEESIVHTFTIYVSSHQTQTHMYVCHGFHKSQSIRIINTRHKFSQHTGYDKSIVWRLMGKNLSQFIKCYFSEKNAISYQSLVHVVNDQLHFEEISLPPSSPSDILNYEQEIVHFTQTAPAMILNQIHMNKISFNFITKNDFLTAIFSTIDKSYRLTDVYQSLGSFEQLIVAQSIFVSRECPLNQQDISPQQCFAISTLFLRPSSSTYLVYHLIPLAYCS